MYSIYNNSDVTAKEADGERDLINQELLLSVFRSLGAYSKYAIEMFVSMLKWSACFHHSIHSNPQSSKSGTLLT